MHDGDVDYSKYRIGELREALSGINRERYPKNYSNLCSAYRRVTGKLPPVDGHELHDLTNTADYSKSKSIYAKGNYGSANTLQPEPIARHPVTGALNWKFSALTAGAIFGALSVTPMLFLFFVPTEVTEANIGSVWSIVLLSTLSAVVTGILFGLGARLSRRRHKWTSIVFSTALFFAMSYSLNGLLSNTYPEGRIWSELLFYGLLGVYTFAAGWRFPPSEKLAPLDASPA